MDHYQIPDKHIIILYLYVYIFFWNCSFEMSIFIPVKIYNVLQRAILILQGFILRQ